MGDLIDCEPWLVFPFFSFPVQRALCASGWMYGDESMHCVNVLQSIAVVFFRVPPIFSFFDLLGVKRCGRSQSRGVYRSPETAGVKILLSRVLRRSECRPYSSVPSFFDLLEMELSAFLFSAVHPVFSDPRLRVPVKVRVQTRFLPDFSGGAAGSKYN